MSKVAVILALIASSVLGAVADDCVRPCPLLYDPVCASNNKTYPNKCVLEIDMCRDNSIQFAYIGKCKKAIDPCAPTTPCSRLWRPICGTDQNSYSNKCYFDKAVCKNPDLRIAHFGTCKKIKR